MSKMTLSQRLTLVFILLLLACSVISGVMQVRSSDRFSQAVIQRLSANLATQIAANNPLLSQNGLDPNAVHNLFNQLMAVNPSVEVYLLDSEGDIVGNAAPAGKLLRQKIDLTPVHELLNGKTMPVYGDNPRTTDQRQVFSAAPLKSNGVLKGYVYIVLLGDDYTALASKAEYQSAIYMAVRSMGMVVLFGLLAGALAFRWVTRPVRKLTSQIAKLDDGGMEAIQALAKTQPPVGQQKDEVAQLQQAFVGLAKRIDQQWQSLTAQDQQRREFIANISHDLRTPLTSLHGYLETLSMKADHLSGDERQRYLDIALAQSRKVGRLAQELFELARLEYGVVKPQKEPFSLCELVQDVFQKFELAAEARGQKLNADIMPDIPLVNADLGMIERVLTNLLDNALRHTPEGGTINVRLWKQAHEVMVQVNDSGPGIAPELKANLFVRPSILSTNKHRAGGLGLMIVRRILQLHGSDIELLDQPHSGASFQFAVPL
ncbi:signal transduction histidine kinase [Ewingella americana]|jgi:signal transduction histidine kinase|uniref:sensor histidine kinase n=1 Tax=Ewingella americana TaxID=41202 RepID=UPI0012AD7970|nr:HAMP domain-containing sensor histidine kinase [Ewingella americana]MRT03108.1 HAMP domain-containing protein [Ewingella americana]